MYSLSFIFSFILFTKTFLFTSPTLTGTPSLPTGTTGITQTALDNSTKLATTAYVDGKMVRGTAVNSTSGTSIDFTGIPSWAKKITVMLKRVIRLSVMSALK